MSLIYLMILAKAAVAPYGWAQWTVSWPDLLAGEDQEIRVDVGDIQTSQRAHTYWLKEVNTKEKTIRWTTTDQCPAAKSVIDSLNKLKIPTLTTPGSTKKNPFIYPMDSARYTIGVPAWFDDRTMAVVTIGGASSPYISNWFSKAQTKLEPCWRAEKPDSVAE